MQAALSTRAIAARAPLTQGSRHHAPPGFTLIEVGIVLLVVALALGAVLRPLGLQVELSHMARTRAALEDAREALLGFAAARGHLPCPDRQDRADGVADARVEGEDGPEDGCAGGVYEGWLPSATLGVGGTDAWGARLRYRVAREHTRPTGDPSAGGACVDPEGDNRCTAELGDTGDLRVYTRNAATRALEALGVGVPAVLWSAGAADPPAGADEAGNLDGETTFLCRDPTPDREACDDARPGAPPCHYDDLLAWLSPHLLASRLVAAGRWP
jgi:type II secretory pathway pseudopilin PulG